MAQRNSPFGNAFGATLFGAVFLGAGAIGYEIKKSNWSIVTGAWTGGPVWWEIWLGATMLAFAVYFWRQAIRTLPR